VKEGDEEEKRDGTDPDEETSPGSPPRVEGVPNGGGIDDQQEHSKG
jgi:hypothetical protein